MMVRGNHVSQQFPEVTAERQATRSPAPEATREPAIQSFHRCESPRVALAAFRIRGPDGVGFRVECHRPTAFGGLHGGGYSGTSILFLDDG